jgi:hypothetical protein
VIEVLTTRHHLGARRRPSLPEYAILGAMETTVRKPELLNVVRAWVREAFELIRLTVSSIDSLPKQTLYQFEVQEFGTTDGTSHFSAGERKEEVPTLIPIIDRELYEALMELPSFKKAISILEIDPQIKTQLDVNVGTELGTHMVRGRQLMVDVLKNMWNANRALEFEEAVFHQIYMSLEQFLFADELETEIFVPLHNCRFEATLQLDRDTCVRPLSESERQVLYSSGSVFREAYRKQLTSMPRAAIVISRRRKKVLGFAYDRNAFMPAIDAVLSLLRFFKAGLVFFELIRISSGPAEWGLFNSYETDSKKVRFGPTYILGSDEIGAFQEHWGRLQSFDWKARKSFDVVRRRFNLAQERELNEDRVIDYVICLEALFSEPEEKTEIAYRLGLRAAKFLADHPDSRRALHNFFKESYNVRSAIVHGSHKLKYPLRLGSDQRMDEEELCRELEEFVRQAMLKFLALPPFDWTDFLLDES